MFAAGPSVGYDLEGMQLATTFRHMDASQAVRTYAEERLDKIRRYFRRDPIGAHATFSVERNHNHTAEFQITLPNGIVIQARETTEDMYSSIDLAGARIERQVRKWKDKIRDHKPHGGPGFSVRQRVIEAGTLEPQPSRGASRGILARPGTRRKGRGETPSTRPPVTPPKAPAIKVVKEQTFTVRPTRVDDAVMQMNLLETEFFVFLDVDTKAVSVVYRRKDGNYGLIETGARLPDSRNT
jgi:putative sigma-54 modulation protein